MVMGGLLNLRRKSSRAGTSWPLIGSVLVVLTKCSDEGVPVDDAMCG